MDNHQKFINTGASLAHAGAAIDHILEQGQREQEWEDVGVVLGGIAVNLRMPKHFIVLPNGGVDLPVATVSLVDGETIISGLELQTADISNALVHTYRHTVLGGTLNKNVDRADVIRALQSAMRLLHSKGGASMAANVTDSGIFEAMGMQVRYDRCVTGGTVSTNYVVTTLANEEGTLRQGTWVELVCSTCDVKPVEVEYADFMKAYSGEAE